MMHPVIGTQAVVRYIVIAVNLIKRFNLSLYKCTYVRMFAYFKLKVKKVAECFFVVSSEMKKFGGDQLT